ncbi:carbohydrate porin [Undibacter mobilis]|uniref:Carbohydrate porin n=1 Tax=Undibacter mobilis TaxID=2292256 RepID=A0A371B9J5_9BRAD|nr:carbohydrate porin [Undibacter mobilis]RDV04093.1 carbohydrate porin [Undibacter mobilis]
MSADSKLRRLIAALAAATALTTVATGGAFAKDKPKAEPSIWERETLTGDWGGRRTALKENNGIEITLIYISEVLGVMSGGINRTRSYEGRLEFSVDTDLQKLIGLAGAKTHFKLYQIHDGGRNAAANVGSIADPSNIDALSTTRLFTAWYEQSFADRFSLRVGQLAADDEFITSPTAGGLINGTFGWAGLLASDITNGGPAYPLAAPGARLATTINDNLTLLTAVFAGNPAGRSNCTVTAQECNEHGLNFGLVGGALWMSELQYAVNQGKGAVGLPAVYKVGGWYSTNDRFADQRFGVDAAGGRVLLSDPASTGAYNHKGNWGLYGVIDQTVLQASERALSLFLRGGFSPSDRNAISYYVDGGVGLKGPFSSRPNDTLTFGVAYAKVSKDAAAADIDAGNAVVRSEEVVFELSYAAQLAPWWTLQPDLQYIVHPGGNVANANDPNGAAIKNAFIAGLRSTIKF